MAPINLYDVTVPSLKQSLIALNDIITKAISTAESKGLKAENIPNERLIEDMRPFTFQIQSACNTSKFIPVRVAGVENVEVPDDETTIEQLQARIKKTIQFLDSVDRKAFDGKEENIVVFRDLKFTGLNYVTKFAMPNFYFHITMAYAILRMKGIEVGKLDYLGPVREHVEQ